MVVPLVVLAGLTVVGGLLNLPFTSLEFLTHWLEPLFEHTPGFHAIHPTSFSAGFFLSTVAVILGVAGILGGRALYSRMTGRDPVKERVGAAAAFFESGWRVDRLYQATIVTPGQKLLDVLNGLFDGRIVDGAVNGVARAFQLGGEESRKVQSGYVRRYALAVFAGTALLVVVALGRSTL